MGNWLVDERVREEKQWYPLQAKTGLELGTQPSLTVKKSKKVRASPNEQKISQ